MTTRVRLSIDLVLPESVTAGQWTVTIGQVLDLLNNVAAHPPVVHAAFLAPAGNVDPKRHALRTAIDASDLAARNKLSALSEIARGTETGDAIVEALTRPEPVLSTREQAEAARKAADVVQQTSEADACGSGQRRLGRSYTAHRDAEVRLLQGPDDSVPLAGGGSEEPARTSDGSMGAVSPARVGTPLGHGWDRDASVAAPESEEGGIASGPEPDRPDTNQDRTRNTAPQRDPDCGTSLCRCSHAFDRHDRIGGSEQRRGACAAYGCRCGIYRAVDRVANANGGTG